jgi:hypothetical protein
MSGVWAAEFKDSGIRANTLSRGVLDTPIGEHDDRFGYQAPRRSAGERNTVQQSEG